MNLPVNHGFKRIVTCQKCPNHDKRNNRCNINGRLISTFVQMMVNECPEKHWLRIETEIAKKQAFELVKLLEAHAYRQHVHDHVIGKEEILLDRTREFITEENAWQMVIDGAFIDYSQDINKMLDFILIEPGAELPEPIIQMSALREPMPCKPCLQRQNSEE